MEDPKAAAEVSAMPRFSLSTFVMIVGFGFCAMAPAQNAPAKNALQTSPPASKSAPARHPAVRPGDRNCIRDTGSLIPPKVGACLPVTGRSYSGDELRRTGYNNAGRALEALDPSVGH
jgi:hypothetical protein